MRRLAFVGCTALLSACMTGDGMQTKLRDASSAYNRALRWGDIDRAAHFLPAEAQQEFLERHEDVREKLVIVDYDVIRLDLDRERGVAASRAEITWHPDRSNVVKKTTIDQAWQFYEGDFVLVDERRASGTPLGIFAEDEELEHPYLPGLASFREAHEIGKENKHTRASKKKEKNK